MKENQQEILFKLSMFEQQVKQIQEQIQAVEHGIVDLDLLNNSLGELTGSKEKEVLSPVGRGIFARTKLISEDLIVDVGGKNFVTKSVPETQKLIKSQIKKLQDVRMDLENNLGLVSNEIEKVISSVEDNKPS